MGCLAPPGGGPLRPSSQRADSDSETEDDEPPSPSVTLPRCAQLATHHPACFPISIGDIQQVVKYKHVGHQCTLHSEQAAAGGVMTPFVM